MVDSITEKQKEVINDILTKISKEDLLPGDRLDTETAIAKRLSLTRSTVREATRILIDQKKIYRVKGSGLFVGDNQKSYPFGRFHVLSPFDYQAEKQGYKGVRKVISAGVIQVPSSEMAQALRIKHNDQVYKILRLMCFDDIPVGVEHIHLPVNMFSHLEFNQLEVSKYAYLEFLTGKKIQRRDQQLCAINLTDSKLLSLLELNDNTAVMEINETVYLDDGMPCEVNIAIINTARFPLSQNSKRP